MLRVLFGAFIAAASCRASTMAATLHQAHCGSTMHRAQCPHQSRSSAILLMPALLAQTTSGPHVRSVWTPRPEASSPHVDSLQVVTKLHEILKPLLLRRVVGV